MRASALTGTAALTRPAWRRDRVRLSVWIVVLGVLPVSTFSTYAGLYPTAATREALAAALRAAPALTALYGPAFDVQSSGGFTAWRIGSFAALFTGLVAAFATVRHTRAEEDSGRAELLAAGAVGDVALPAAALATAASAAVATGLVQAAVLAGAGAPPAGALALGAGSASVGVVSAALALVLAQVLVPARAAVSTTVALLGLSYVLRAVGDARSAAAWLGWLSPVGWSQRLRPFAGERWSVLLLPLAATVLLTVVAAGLLRRRDLGRGLLPERRGRAVAVPALRSASALAWRLHRPAVTGWVLGLLAVGLLFGTLTGSIGAVVGESSSREVLERYGGDGVAGAYLAALTTLLGLGAAACAVQAVLRARREEADTHLDLLLAAGVRRGTWLRGHLLVALAGSAATALAGGVGLGVTATLSADGVPGPGQLALAALAQLPAAWLLAGLAAALVGCWPRACVAAWIVLGASAALSLFGPAAGVAQRVLDVSPFGRPAWAPGGPVDGGRLLALALPALLLLVAGVVGLRRRDLRGD